MADSVKERARTVFTTVSEQTAGLHQQLQSTSKTVVEQASQHAENVDFCSENLIGAVVVCVWSMLIWLLFLPVFHLGIVPWMASWEGMHGLTVSDYMAHAEATYPTPQVCFEVLDVNGDKNSTREEFLVGSKTFKKQVFRYPAEARPIFDAIDANKDGKIQEGEFYAATPAGVPYKWRVNMTDLKTRAKQAYGFLDSYYTQALDIQSDSKVTEKEFVDAAALLSPPIPIDDAKRLFLEADKDGNHMLEPREWVSYSIPGNFTFNGIVPEDVKFPGPRITLSVTAGLTSCLQTIPTDLIEIESIQDASQPRLLRSIEKLKGTPRFIKVSFEVLTGTRSRFEILRANVLKLPNKCFTNAFEFALLAGGSTTARPMATMAPALPGPVTDKELEQYFHVPAIVQGRTELLLRHEKVGTVQVAQRAKQLMPVLQKTYASFGDCDFTVEDGEVSKVQDTSGQSSSNRTMIFKFTADIKNAGEFQKKVTKSGQSLVDSIKQNVIDQHFPDFAGVKIHVWTRFTAAYYGSAVAGLKRGSLLNQHFGMFERVRNDTGSRPFVKATSR